VYIGVLGGTGPAGRAVAARLASVGIDVTVGSRSHDRARATCDAICDEWSSRALPLVGGENTDAAAADLVIVATPWDAAPATVAGVASQLEGKVLVSMANAVVRLGDEFVPLLPPRGSVAGSIQAVAGVIEEQNGRLLDQRAGAPLRISMTRSASRMWLGRAVTSKTVLWRLCRSR